ncbi:MAG: hypothetical protein RIQ78_1554 [Bacteroidota bacterium]|jgi:hypothetical protein
MAHRLNDPVQTSRKQWFVQEFLLFARFIPGMRAPS